MKKSKITLLFKLLPITIYVIFSCIYPKQSLYTGNETNITGYIYNCTKKEDKTVIKIKAKENIIINYYDKFNCKLGIKIKAKGEMKLPKENTNFYLFNYKNYLLSLNIHYTFTANNIKIINKQPSIIYQIKNSLKNHIKKYKTKDYLNALILGDTNDIEQDIKESYQINGISHLLAISGAQITLLATFIMYIFKFLGKNISNIITIIILIFYLFITDFQPSILRATIFFILLSLNKIFELKKDSLSLLIITANILLIINPYYIYSLGFLLSFTVSFYLLLFKKIFQTDNYLTKTLKISLIAFTVSAPILINSFFSLNLLTPFINLYFVPLMAIIYPISILTFFFKPFDNILLILIKIMETASVKLQTINLNITLCHINIFFVIIYYIIITIILYLWEKDKNYLYIYFICLIIHHNINYLNPNSTLTMLDVGQGDSILIKLNNNQGNILIDTGGEVKWDGSEPYDIAKNITVPYLKAEGINKIDYLILTHGDFDHAGMTLNLMENIKINHIILNKENNNLEKKIIKNFKGKITNMDIGTLKINDITLNFLNGLNAGNENDDSLIIYTKKNLKNILLMGDASAKSEKYILDTYNLPKMDILKVGHHGSKTSSSKEFIKIISPKISLISAGENNLYSHPHQETLNNLKKSKIFITLKDGAIKINLNKSIITTAR